MQLTSGDPILFPFLKLKGERILQFHSSDNQKHDCWNVALCMLDLFANNFMG